jgi:hypothetical protein
MGKFLGAFDLAELNQEDINHSSRSITSNKTEAVMASQQKKAQDPMESQTNSTAL